jgi:hypothetical protein
MTIRKTDWIFPSSRISMAGIHPFHSIPSRLLSVAFLVRRFQPMERIRSRATKLVYFERSERYFNGASERDQRSVLFVESQTTKKSDGRLNHCCQYRLSRCEAMSVARCRFDRQQSHEVVANKRTPRLPAKPGCSQSRQPKKCCGNSLLLPRTADKRVAGYGKAREDA